jgi:hypothetical protein
VLYSIPSNLQIPSAHRFARTAVDAENIVTMAGEPTDALSLKQFNIKQNH